MKKRLDLIEERRRNFDLEWNKLNEEEKKIDAKKEQLLEKNVLLSMNNDANNYNNNSQNEDDLKIKYEIEKLKLEKSDLETKLNNMQKVLDKFYAQNSENILIPDLKINSSKNNLTDENALDNKKININSSIGNDSSSENDSFNDSDQLITKINAIGNQIEVEEEEKDDNDMKELVEHAKLKLKLKYFNAKKKAQIETGNKNATFVIDNDMDTEDEDKNEETSENRSVKLNTSKNVNENVSDELSENRRFLLDNLNKEKDAMQMANELLDRYRQSLIKRKLKLDAAKLDLKNDEQVYTKLKPNEKLKHQHSVEDRKLILEKEELDLEQLGLNIKTGKRLIKQKKFQLNLLENNILGNENDLSDSDLSQDDLIEDSAANSKNTSYLTKSFNEFDSFKNNNNNNLEELIKRLKNAHSKNELHDLNIQKIQPILKKIPKLNNRLEITFENMSTPSNNENNFDSNRLNRDDLKKPFNYIDEKWKKYVGETTINDNDNKKINFFQNIHNSINPIQMSSTIDGSYSNNKIINGAWENSPAYHKLTFESGNKLLDQKWNQYLGTLNTGGTLSSNSLNKFSKTLNSVQTLKKSNSSYYPTSRFNSTITLPESTQARLAQHREWLKKFKADNEFSNNIGIEKNNQI